MKEFSGNDVKRLLKLRPIIEAEKRLTYAKAHGIPDEQVSAEVHDLISLHERRLKCIDSLFSVLTEDEAFIVRRHVMDELDWYRIMKEHVDMWGSENEKSIRTFQIYQARALKKMADFINYRDDVELFRGMLEP
ncbi:MAG: hypothetical protein GX781_03840 [Clostridiales bacterium]|nr:hypothetical protein [Clostridiales bacterium]